MYKLPDLEAWAIFAKVAETGSFAKTAAVLSITQPTVSKAITRLETRLNIILFHRTSRRVELTESGRLALERAFRILEEGEALESELSEEAATLQGLIKISAPMSFGIAHLSPALPAFLEQYPNVKLEIEFSDDFVDLVANRFDLALRISVLNDSSLLVRRLCDVPILLVGAPSYFKRYGYPQHPRDLADHRTLQYAYSHSGHVWRFKTKVDDEYRHQSKQNASMAYSTDPSDQKEMSHVVDSSLTVNNAEALLPTLKAGLGIALQPAFLVSEQIKRGEVEVVMSDWQVDAISLYLVTPPGRKRPARVQALMAYLANYFANHPFQSP